ncbi:sensor histidine kinase [Streptomyces sp. NPDC001744]|uniref:sensor histidine kinase n=1 Tax=Streptomyces sp. NPDC001744 TaxID=3364606 RepID=UPI0036B2E98E
MRLNTLVRAARTRWSVPRADGFAEGPVTATILGLVLLGTAAAAVRAWLSGSIETALAGWVAAAGWGAFALWYLLAFRTTSRQDTTPGRPVRLLLLAGTVAAEGLVLTWAPPSAVIAAPLLFAAMASAAADLTVPAGVGLLAVGALALAGGDLLATPTGTPTSHWAVAIWAVLLTTLYLIGLTRRSARIQHEQARLLLEQTEQTQAERQRTAALDERARIAREIHDVLAHSLGALAVQLETATALLEADPPRTGQAAETVHKARRIAVEGLTETRRAISALRQDTMPLADAVRALADSLQERHAGPVRVQVTGTARALPEEVSLSLVRVTQEALGNAAKHAPDRPVDLTLAYEANRVRLIICSSLPAPDDPPAQTHQQGGYGLAGMRERLRLVGGTLSAGPGPEGWTVRAEVEA